MTMLETVAAYIEYYQLLPDTGTVVVAVSGGADSLCLLHILHRLCGPGKRYGDVRLHVAHLNHRLRGAESERDAAYVKLVARAWGLPVTVGVEDVRALAETERLSLEEAARVARYRFLRKVAGGVAQEGRIAIAHHADDQVETLLLHLLRGGGLASMVGMQSRRGDIIRPLLAVSRADILAYCREHGIAAMEDSSNADPHYLRNRVRHELLPLLESLNPGIRATLLRSADTARVDDEYIESQVDMHWSGVVGVRNDGCTIHIPALLALPLSLRRRLLRRVTATLCGGQSPLEPRHYELIERFLYNTNNGEERSLDLPAHLRLSRIFDTCQVFIVHQPEKPLIAATQESFALPIPGRAVVAGMRWLATAEVVIDDVTQAVRQAIARDDWVRVWQLLSVDSRTVYIDGDTVAASLTVRTRHAGDRIRPLGMAREKKVQDVLVDAHVPRAERETIPLFFSGKLEEQCIWLAGLCLADSVKLTATTRRIVRLKIISI